MALCNSKGGASVWRQCPRPWNRCIRARGSVADSDRGRQCGRGLRRSACGRSLESTGTTGCDPGCPGGTAYPRDRAMPIHRSSCLALALVSIAGVAWAETSPSADLRGCTLPASPSPEQPCQHQMARLGIDGVEAVTDMDMAMFEPQQIATFDLTGMLLISPEGRTVMRFPDEGAAVAAADDRALDVEATGSITPVDPQ